MLHAHAIPVEFRYLPESRYLPEYCRRLELMRGRVAG
jgi:hypothetical protein